MYPELNTSWLTLTVMITGTRSLRVVNLDDSDRRSLRLEGQQASAMVIARAQSLGVVDLDDDDLRSSKPTKLDDSGFPKIKAKSQLSRGEIKGDVCK